MMEDEYIQRIRLATELATKKIIAIHRKNKDNSENENKIYEYESLFRSMIYHELMNLGIYFGDVKMDNPINSEKKELKTKKPDIWIENNGNKKSYVLEIKMIKHHEKSKIIQQINADKDHSIIKDIRKLSSLILEMHDDVMGIMVISYQSPNFPENDDPVDLMENEIRKIIKKIKPPDNLMFILCSEDSCKVFKTMEMLKKRLN